MKSQVPHLALHTPDMPAAAKSLPPALPARPAPEKALRSDTQVCQPSRFCFAAYPLDMPTKLAVYTWRRRL